MSHVIPFTDAIEIMGISRALAERLLRDPNSDFLRPFKLGRRRYYRVSDVYAYLAHKASQAQIDANLLAAIANPEAASAPPPAHAASGATHCVPLAAVGQADLSR